MEELAAAAARLRRPPGRPRTRPERPPATRVEVSRALQPRLLDRARAAAYLAVSRDVVDGYISAGVLRRVRLPGAAGGDLRRVLLDVRDLDGLIERSKVEARPEASGR